MAELLSRKCDYIKKTVGRERILIMNDGRYLRPGAYEFEDLSDRYKIKQLQIII